ncbi:GNAT family N-acetyltransferase [Streptomyces sp. E-08]|uniref:GNAT family N-acetyltransferase n=1 Tax=Streptomyces sp. E-08 TaxID=3404047 RepID=UPI003CF2906B
MDPSPPAPGPDTRIDLADGLTLRAYEGEADRTEYLRVVGESVEHLRPWMPWAAEHDPERLAAFLTDRAELWARGEAYSYAIVLDGAMVGSCGLHRHDDTPDGAIEIGYWLHPSVTGRGLATRAARALVEQAFRLPGVTTVEIVHDVAHHASAAVPARLGFNGDLRRPHEPTAPAETGEDRIWRLERG